MKKHAYAPALLFAWDIAAHEARAAGQPTIDPEQLLCALLKLADLAPHLERVVPDAAARTALRADIASLSDILDAADIEATATRRRLREIVGRGSQPMDNARTMQRGTAARQCFERAAQIAHTAHCAQIGPCHLLQALCESPTARMTRLFGELGASAGAIVHLAAQANAPGAGAARAIPSADAPESAARPPGDARIVRVPSAGDALSKLGRDLTALAQAGDLDPAIGRRNEMLQTVRTLSRRTKSNPVLVGEAGVGKTAIVEGLAVRIAERNIVRSLWDHRIVELRMSTLLAGTKHRGDFEERLTEIVAIAERDPKLILFLDELHALVGAGGSGGNDAAGILKPALARGAIRCIGATTFDEYRRDIESDPALARRFIRIRVDEPSEDEAIEILRGLRERFESHHAVRIKDEALVAAVQLSRRYVKDRRLPDKAIDLVDEACAMARVETLSFVGGAAASPRGAATLAAVEPVDAQMIAEVVSEKTGIDTTELSGAGAAKMLELEARLGEQVYGQDAAVAQIAGRLRLAAAGLRDTARPMAVLAFLGPTGVGKTWLARCLAEAVFPGQAPVLRIDMSEYMERHNAARLIGAPPGYIGHDEEGQLTGPLGRQPYSLVLLDEIEKAHSDVWDLFLQVFDDGRLTDGRGRTVDASHAVFVMTSNLGAGHVERRPIGFVDNAGTDASDGGNRPRYLAALKAAFRPELVNRIDEIVVFESLDERGIAKIAAREIEGIRSHLAARGITLDVDDKALAALAREGFSPEFGARQMRRTVEERIAEPLSAILLGGHAGEGDRVQVVLEGDRVVVTTQS